MADTFGAVSLNVTLQGVGQDNPIAAHVHKLRNGLRRLLITTSTFGAHILHVVALSAEEKVIRANAGAHVAMVQNQESGRNRPDGEFIGCAVSAYGATVQPELAIVSSAVECALPKPTVARAFHQLPKAIGSVSPLSSPSAYARAVDSWLETRGRTKGHFANGADCLWLFGAPNRTPMTAGGV